MPIPHLKSAPRDDRTDDRTNYRLSWRDVRGRGAQGGDQWFRSVLTFMKKMPGSIFRRNRGPKGKGRFLRLWLPIGGVIFLVFVLGALIAFSWFSRDLPDPERISDRSVAQSTRIYARDGTTLLYEIHGDERRTVVELNDINPDVINATIAIEDKDFYKHGGISIVGIIRAIWRDVTTGSSQGGSTITQQFVKNAILTNEKTVTRKIREWVLSYQIERKFTKQQILKLYFNEIPYGANAYGIEAASKTYFGKSAKSLDLAESAILAALPQAPSFYSPYGNNADRLLSRSHYILDVMAEQQYITREQAEAAKKAEVLKNVKPKREAIIAPHFVFYVRDLLAQKYGDRIVEQGGLKVTTTLDPQRQTDAEQTITDQAATNETKWKATNASLVAIDPKTGQVLAMAGSRDYFDTTIDGNVNVALTLQQPGSSIKPIVYATAFSRGFTPNTMLFDLTTRFKMSGAPDYVPHNYDGKEHGPQIMRSALAGSLNIPAVKTLYLAGLDNVIDQAQKMGYSTWNDRSRFGLSLVLGGAEVKLLDHTAAFGSFATDGVLHATTPILKVEDKSGRLLEEFKDNDSRVLDQNVAREINDVLSDNRARSFIFGERNRLTLPDRPVAAKTGTTQEYRDAWTMGYTSATGKEPGIVVGVWVGNNDNTPMRAGADGSVVAAPIWNAFMRKAVAGTKAERFNKPTIAKSTKPMMNGKLEGDSPINVDVVTGKEIPSSCLDSWPKEFVVQKTVKAVHDILFYVDPSDPTGPLPKNPKRDPQFSGWETPVKKWAKKNNYVDERPPEESCSLRASSPLVTINAPSANATLQGDSINVAIAVTGERAITGVNYYIDDVLVQQTAEVTANVVLTLKDVPNGFHTIQVVAKDDIGSIGSSTVNINVLKDASISSIYFMSPPYNAAFAAGSSITLRAFVHDPGGVSKATFQVEKPDASMITVDTVAIGSDSVATVTWTAPSQPGIYRFIVRATTDQNKPLQSDFLVVTLD